MLDAMVLEETDPQKLDRIASAQAKLAEQERILDGRPLPGSRRPGSERPARMISVSAVSTPILPETVPSPEPIPSCGVEATTGSGSVSEEKEPLR